jgi:uncharacterized lipoprotein YddW (UPF0748 family)
MMRPILLPACAVACVLATVHAPLVTARAEEVRGLWVAHTTLASPLAIARMVQSARSSGFNRLLVQVRARGDAYYNGGLEPRAPSLSGQPAAFDPLQVTLAEARRAGLRVHAWISVNLVSSAVELPVPRSHVLYQHPEWLMIPRSIASEMHVLNPRSPLYLGKLARTLRPQSAEVEGFYLSPIHPGAVDYLARIVADIVTRYAVDGVHLDYVRYPSDDFDYSRQALSLFAAEVRRDLTDVEARALRSRESSSPLLYVDRFPERWRQFRRARLTALVRRLRFVLKTRRPTAVLSAAVVPDATEASERRLQDWQLWATTGAIDVVCPMAYASDTTGFTAQIDGAQHAAGGRPLWAGIGAYRLSVAQTIENIQIARRLGTAGIVLFSYDSLVRSSPNGDALSQIGRAVFQD